MQLIRKVLKNEAIRSDPPEIYNARVVMISLVACGASLLFGLFDMGVIGGILTMKTFQVEYGLTDRNPSVLANLSSNIVSVIQAGAFAGALIAMWLANRIGRRWSLIFASVVVIIGVTLQAGASGYIEALYVGRLVAGISIGIASTVCPLYISENAPRGIRGLLTGLYQLTLVSGLTIAFWVNYACERRLTGKKQFIIPLALQAVPGVILFVGMLLADESPRYLAQQDPAAALQVLAKLRGLPVTHEYVVEEMANIKLQLEEEREIFATSSRFSILKEAFCIKSYRRRSILCITLMMWSNLTGTNAMTYYSPSIFASIGLSGASVGLFATGIYGIVKVICCTVFIIFVVDSLGRRRSLLWTGIAQGTTLVYVGFYIRFDPPTEGQSLTASAYIALVAIYIFAGVYQFGWGPVVWSYCAEIPSARLRPLNMGMATASQWLFNFAVAKATPSMLATLGSNGYGTFFVYGGFCFTMVIYTWFFVPETKGLSLECMDELFEMDTVRGKFIPSRVFHATDMESKGLDDKAKRSVDHIETVAPYH